MIWLVTLGLSFAWGRDWKVVFISLLVGPFILPVLLVTFAAQIALSLPDRVLHRAPPERRAARRLRPDRHDVLVRRPGRLCPGPLCEPAHV